MGQAKPGKTYGLMGMGLRLTHQDAAGRIFRQFWTRTEPFSIFLPGPVTNTNYQPPF